MAALVLDCPAGIEHTVASETDDRRRALRDRGHQLRATRRRSTLPRLKHASARSAWRSHPRRAVDEPLSQVTSGVYDDPAEIHGGLSCLANGERKRIDQIREGDYVLATDPETGESGPREVIATLPHTDQLLTLRLSSGDVVTTEDHKYWNQTDQAWQESQHLDQGDRLLTADGDIVTVEGLDWATVHTDDAYDLTIDDLHTFYVGAGEENVLVHNCKVTPTQHSVQQKINRGVRTADEIDALKNPLQVRPVVYDELGRPSQRYIGAKAEVVINPETGKIVSVNPTSSSKARRLGGG